MRHVDLDPVGAALELLASGLARLDRAVDDLRALRHFDLRRVTFEVVSAAGRDRARDDEEARPRDAAFVDRHLDSHVAVTRPFGFDISERRESLLERAADGDG